MPSSSPSSAAPSWDLQNRIPAASLGKSVRIFTSGFSAVHRRLAPLNCPALSGWDSPLSTAFVAEPLSTNRMLLSSPRCLEHHSLLQDRLALTTLCRAAGSSSVPQRELGLLFNPSGELRCSSSGALKDNAWRFEVSDSGGC